MIFLSHLNIVRGDYRLPCKLTNYCIIILHCGIPYILFSVRAIIKMKKLISLLLTIGIVSSINVIYVNDVSAASELLVTSPAAAGGGQIPSGYSTVVFRIGDGDWTETITLPSTGSDGNTVKIISYAKWDANIAGNHQIYKSSTQLKSGDHYEFTYNSGLKGWLLESAPERVLRVRDIGSRMSSPTSPRTTVLLYNGSWVSDFHLPSNAGDRDRVTLKSAAAWPSTISGANINNYKELTLTNNNEYELIYIAENKLWEVIKDTATRYQAKNLAGGVLPTLTRPVTIVDFGNYNWVPNLYLPASSINHRVVVKSSALWSFKIHGLAKPVQIHDGQEVSFKVDAKGNWQQETIVIDVLMLYSHKAAARLGESAMRARMFESFNITNEALENSGVNFRIRMAGLKKLAVPNHWKTLYQSLVELRNHSTAQAWRKELGADAVYYEGTEEGCGLAWADPNASYNNMVATGSLNCGTTVMRHEFGHNMGLTHSDYSIENTKKYNYKIYARGYNAVETIMGGNKIPYYSTPKRYTELYGFPMGIHNHNDAVRAMNEVSEVVAAHS